MNSPKVFFFLFEFENDDHDMEPSKRYSFLYRCSFNLFLNAYRKPWFLEFFSIEHEKSNKLRAVFPQQHRLTELHKYNSV